MIHSIGIIQNAVEPDLCDYLSYESAELQEGKLGVRDDSDSSTRRSQILFLNEPMKEPTIYSQIMSVFYNVNEQMFNFDLSTIETIQYTEYDSSYNGFYDFHVDTHAELQPNQMQRKLSLSIQLSDPSEYQGGELVFQGVDYDPEEIKQKACAIIFPSYLLHSVTPVTKGKRKSLVSWCTGPNFR